MLQKRHVNQPPEPKQRGKQQAGTTRQRHHNPEPTRHSRRSQKFSFRQLTKSCATPCIGIRFGTRFATQFCHESIFRVSVHVCVCVCLRVCSVICCCALVCFFLLCCDVCSRGALSPQVSKFFLFPQGRLPELPTTVQKSFSYVCARVCVCVCVCVCVRVCASMCLSCLLCVCVVCSALRFVLYFVVFRAPDERPNAVFRFPFRR